MATPDKSRDTVYSHQVLSLGPVGYWKLNESGGTIAHDSSGNRRHGTYWGDPSLGEPGVDDCRGVRLNGEDQYIEIADDDAWSQPTTGAIMIVAWIRPDSLAMPSQEGSGYVHWMGKGEPDEHEWAARMYQTGNSEDRENRFSLYAFNRNGGTGNGSYFQDPVIPGEWIMVAGVITPTEVAIFKNGVERDRDLLDQATGGGPVITPENTMAPIRLGTRDKNSFFQGTIDEVAIFPRELTEAEIAALHASVRDSP